LNGDSSLIPDVRPPNPPWIPISNRTSNIATLSYYYSDAKSLVPIRDVTTKNDAKRDPNLETLTYGLFSKCCRTERKAIVENGITTQFFCTARSNSIRVLTGYYRPAWYCQIDADDYAIAAESARFVSPGFVFADLSDFLGKRISWFRTWRKILGEELIWRLKLLIDSAPNATETYLSEIHRLEASELEQNGIIYNDINGGRNHGFSWEDAGLFLRDKRLI